MNIAIIGDFDPRRPAHAATQAAVQETAASLAQDIVVQWIPTRSLETDANLAQLGECDGILGAPGDPDSSHGVINAIRYGRENGIPYLGT